jgi:hypothetical protein
MVQSDERWWCYRCGVGIWVTGKGGRCCYATYVRVQRRPGKRTTLGLATGTVLYLGEPVRSSSQNDWSAQCGRIWAACWKRITLKALYILLTLHTLCVLAQEGMPEPSFVLFLGRCGSVALNNNSHRSPPDTHDHELPAARAKYGKASSAPRRAALAQPRLPTLLGTGSKPLLRVGPGTTGYYYYAARDAFPYPAK